MRPRFTKMTTHLVYQMSTDNALTINKLYKKNEKVDR